LSRLLLNFLFTLLSDPNVGMPVTANWPEYDPENREYLLVKEPCSNGKNYGEENYKFWNEVMEPMRVVPKQNKSS